MLRVVRAQRPHTSEDQSRRRLICRFKLHETPINQIPTGADLVCALPLLRQNEDIDIALDNCTGVAFADMVNAYLSRSGQEQGKVAVIEV